jgi:hypothetical protein
MVRDDKAYTDPDETLRRLRLRIRGGGRPPLESLSREEMAAANVMITGGEAEIASYSCRLFLIAKVEDEHAGVGAISRATRDFLKNL